MSPRTDLNQGARLLDGTASFRIWAPEKQTVELVLFEANQPESRSFPMLREAGDFFTFALSAARAPLYYGYRVDGAGPFPDPFSRSQPFGVHGPSELPDETFDWTDATWRGVRMSDAIIAEIHVGTATAEGTFEALIPRLAHYQALGVTVLELLPVAAFPGTRNWGYDGVQLFAPSHAYGGPQGLRRLIDAAHAQGLAVLIDVVLNHFGPDGNYLGVYSSRYFTKRHHTPWGDAIDYVQPPVRELARACVEHWIRDFHADGVRLDATHAIFDDGEPHLLRELVERARLVGAGRQVLVIAEDDRNERRLLLPQRQGGFGLDAVWADDFHHQLRRLVAGDSDGYFEDYPGGVADLVTILNRGWLYEGRHSVHHNAPRGTSAEGLAPEQFVHCLQNHDQVGNRAFGDRLSKAVDPPTLRAATALLLLSPSTPLLFMGQEWAASTPFQYFTDHTEELGQAVTRGRREEFKRFAAFAGAEIPDPQDAQTFWRSKLDWSEREQPEGRRMVEWHRALLALRRTHAAFLNRERGSFQARALDSQTIVLDRSGPGSAAMVVVHLRGQGHVLLPRACRLILSSEDARFGGSEGIRVQDQAVHFAVPGAAIFTRE